MKKLSALIACLLLLGACNAGPGAMNGAAEGTASQYHKITAEEAYEMMQAQEVIVVDVRTAAEYESGHIENAVLVPNESIGDSMPEALPDTDAVLLVYCRSGRRSKEASEKLLAFSYQNVYDFGGISDWPYDIVEGKAMNANNGMSDAKTGTEHVIYLAGGCFWGIEKLMQSIPGVIDATSGYANGVSEADANYRTVSGGATGFRETVRVQYDPEKVSLDALLMAYFYVIDPTVTNRQGNDVGSQYQTGVYYAGEGARETVERIAAIEAGRNETFAVEIGPLVNFYPAEEYHQDYLDKNPGGYCHIPTDEIALFSRLMIDPGDYQKPAVEVIEEKLTREQFEITQNSATERPFANEYWDEFGKGLYVDVVTGEPLFTSLDKFESSCGWPAFSKPIEEPVVVENEDLTHGMRRVEVRSRAGDSHLGHVFTGDAESPNGVRYCINSAALRCIPYGQMEQEGYGYLLSLFE